MKTYKINNVEVSADQIKEIIKNNPELLEENKGGRYFFPKEKENFWFTGQDGSVYYRKAGEDNGFYDNNITLGVFRTEEEAELARDKQKAIVACWKWAQKNTPFEPDWKNNNQKKYYVSYDHFLNKIKYNTVYFYQSQFTLPHFESEKDCKAFIEANKEHLELLFKN